MVTRRIEVWSVPDDPNGFKPLDTPDIETFDATESADAIAGGRMVLSADYEYADLLLTSDPADPSNSATSLIRVFRDDDTTGLPDLELFVEEVIESVDDAGRLDVELRDIRAGLDDGVIEEELVWGGVSALPPLGLGDLASIKAVYELVVDASAGTFTITVDGDTTEAIPFNANARRIEGTSVGTPQGLQGLTTVQDVTVTGTGAPADEEEEVEADPFVITFYNPPNPGEVTVDDSGLTGSATLTLIEGGVLDPAPITISKPADQQAGDPADYGNYGNPPLEVVNDVVDAGADYSILVHAVTQFAGSQVVFEVEPGETYSDTQIRVRPTITGAFAIVARTVFGDLIARREVTLTADSFQTLTLPAWVAPTGASQAILRVAAVDATPANIGDFYVNWQGAGVWTGDSPSTAGEYVLQVLDDIQTRGALTWVEAGFTASVDANGDAWDDSALPFRADLGQAFGTHFLGDLARMGYVHDLVPKPRPLGGFTPGDPTHTLKLWNPFARTSGISVKQGVVAGALLPGSKFARRRVPRTHILVETDDGETKWITDSRVSSLPRRESFVRAEYVNEQGADLVGAAVLNDDINNLFAVQVQFADGIEPYRDFDIGDTIPVESGRVVRHNRTVHSISLKMADGVWTSEVTASRLYRDALTRTYEAVRRLYDEFNRRRGRGGDKTVTALPAPPANAATGAHLHLLADSQAVDDEAVEWASLLKPPLSTPTPAFPTTEVQIQEPGYYCFHVDLTWSDYHGGGDVWLTRTRGGFTETVWPPFGTTGVWSSPGGSRFTDVAPAIECQAGDVFEVWADTGGSETVSQAILVPYLVDRAGFQVAASTGVGEPELAVTSFNSNTFGQNTYSTSLPSLEAGDLLVVIATGNDGPATATGWTYLDHQTGSSLGTTVLWKIADGSETNITVTFPGNTGHATIALRFHLDGANWASNPPVVEFGTATASSPVTFPTVNASGWYWVVPFTGDRNQATPTTIPDGYPTLVRTSGSGTLWERGWAGSNFEPVPGSVSPGTIGFSGLEQAIPGVLLVRGL